MFQKKISRIRRFTCFRSKIKKLSLIRLVVHRTSYHIYAQIVSSDGSKILVAASTLEKDLSQFLRYTGNKDAAFVIGKTIAIRSLHKCIYNVSFDRSGFKYHGRIKVLADAARKFGLNF